MLPSLSINSFVKQLVSASRHNVSHSVDVDDIHPTTEDVDTISALLVFVSIFYYILILSALE